MTAAVIGESAGVIDRIIHSGIGLNDESETAVSVNRRHPDACLTIDRVDADAAVEVGLRAERRDARDAFGPGAGPAEASFGECEINVLRRIVDEEEEAAGFEMLVPEAQARRERILVAETHGNAAKQGGGEARHVRPDFKRTVCARIGQV